MLRRQSRDTNRNIKRPQQGYICDAGYTVTAPPINCASELIHIIYIEKKLNKLTLTISVMREQMKLKRFPKGVFIWRRARPLSW